MCKKHNGNLISLIHSDAEREFNFSANFNRIIQDDDDVRAKRAELLQNDRASLIALGDALAYQMRYNEALEYYIKARDVFPDDYEAHRKCAIRFLSVLKVDEAEQEFLWCEKRTDDILDIAYRLALCAYYKGDYVSARDKFASCYNYCRDNGEMYVAVLYWHIQCLIRLRQDVGEAMKYYYDGLNGGHHIGYMKTVKLFLSGDNYAHSNHSDITIDLEDELNLSIYLYGCYAYLLYVGDEQKALCELDEALKLNTYFSSFAYLGAYSEKQRVRNNALMKLKEFFQNNRKVAIAFSGGTDSALLLSIAVSERADVRAYFVRTEFQPDFEVADAVKLASEVGVDCEFIDVSALADGEITVNDKNRCYFCKRRIFSTLTGRAKHYGYGVVIDGTNASDDLNDRPGVRALREFGVLSPLRECGLTKSDVRYISKRLGLFTWNKPSYSCLATRIATGEHITAENLLKIEKAETCLFEKGYTDFRVRYADRCAKIEISKAQNDKFQNEKQEIFNELANCFDKVEQSDVLR